MELKILLDNKLFNTDQKNTFHFGWTPHKNDGTFWLTNLKKTKWTWRGRSVCPPSLHCGDVMS